VMTRSAGMLPRITATYDRHIVTVDQGRKRGCGTAFVTQCATAER
jgi:hypothetical protein